MVGALAAYFILDSTNDSDLWVGVFSGVAFGSAIGYGKYKVLGP
jgi:hypothetical protein